MTEDLIAFCAEKGIGYRVLSDEEKDAVLALINERYLNKDAKRGLTLFDRLKISEAAAANDSDSWRWLYPILKGRKAVVFGRPEDKVFAELEDCGSFFEFYDNYAAVEFYLMDPDGEYLCGYNHSHCAFAMGTAADLLENTEEYRKLYGL